MHATTNTLLVLLTIVRVSSLQHKHSHGNGSGSSCIPTERESLLSFKNGITTDPANRLASWRGQDCCQWRGVKCNKKTNHVIKLQLPNQDPAIDPFNLDACDYVVSSLFGKISPSLLSLEHIKHIDLSMNCLIIPSSRMPLFLSSMRNLRYLNLSGIPFTGRVPPQFGNLSKLRHLDLSYNEMYSTDITWLTNLPFLQYLSMKTIDLTGIADWPYVLNLLPSLRVIDLSCCNLESANQSLSLINLTKLERLDLSFNGFNHTIASSWFWNVTSLNYLNLGYNLFFGQFHEALANMTLLQVLDLSFNQNLVMTGNFKKLCSLKILDLTCNEMNGDIAVLMERLQQCAVDKLQELHLSYNNFTGSLPDFLGSFTRLKKLDLKANNISGYIPLELANCTSLNTLGLSNNHLSGSVPTDIGTLTDLTSLDLSNNNLSGVIMEEHFTGLISLKKLDLSSNNLKVVVDESWVPTFRLESASFRSCKMGARFPTWIKQQLEITLLDISSACIKDKIPDWFWTTFSQATYLDISNNEIRGSLPSHLRDMAVIQLNLSANQLTGPIPTLPRNITMLDISNNFLSGLLPSNLSESSQLHTLLLYSNRIGGRFPESFCKLKLLYDLDLSSNLLEGEIPNCFDIKLIEFLLLSDNNLSGNFPVFLQNCTGLQFLDLASNNFSGRLTSWIGKLVHLRFLRLSHNAFFGGIPFEIVNLINLQYMDLSGNNLSGVIPWHLSNLTAMNLMASGTMPGLHGSSEDGNQMMGDVIIIAGQFGEIVSIITKGQKLRYGGALEYFISIDLSSNFLTGEIPSDIATLDGLINLNLSSNNLIGKIPDKIGAMSSLESLDLSKNKLVGEIPLSLSNLTSLSYLNLSYNSLSGRIPSGQQLDTLNADNPALMYIGNSGLCGPPVRKNCSGNDTYHGGHRSHRHRLDPMSIHLGLVLGFLVGLWMVFCFLLFKKSWRIAYFHLFDKLYDSICVFVIVKWARLIRNFVADK